MGRTKGIKSLVISGLIVAAIFSQQRAEATPIEAAEFSSTAANINFDNLSGGACLGCGTVITNQYAEVGVTFGNAVVTANTHLATLMPAASPSNVAFVYQGGGSNYAPLSIFFSVAVNKVGFDFGSSLDSFLTISAYDSANVLIEKNNFVGSSAPVGLAGFAGLEESTNIARIDVSYHPDYSPSTTFNYSIDNLRFESSTTEVPEPASIALFCLGLIGLGWSKKRRA